MKSFLKFAFAIIAVAIMFSSCGKSSDEGAMIPSNAMFVSHIDMKSMGKKLSWDDIKQTSWYKKAYSDSSTPDWRKKILDNPASSGIDFDKGLIFFAQKGTGDDFHLVVEGSIKSEKDFELFNKNFDPAQTVRKEGSVNLLTLKDKNVVGWDGNHFVYTMNSSTTSSELYKWNQDKDAQPNPAPTDNSADLSAYCVKLFSLKSDSSLAKNQKFSSLLSEKGDLHFWQNTEEIMKSVPNMGMLGMLKLDAFFKDNVTTYTANFDNGKIEIDQKGYASKELTDLLKSQMNGKVNNDMIKDIPSQNVFGVLATSFKPGTLVALIKLTGADGFINTYAQQMGFSLDDFSKATNGNMLLAFSDFKMKADSFNYKDDSGNEIGSGKFNKPDLNFIFSVGIGDKASLQKVIGAGKTLSTQMGKDSLFQENMNDKRVAFSNTPDFAKQYLAGGNNKFDFTDKISGHPIGLYIDFHKILSELATAKSKDPNENVMLDQSLKMWNNMVMTGGDFKGGAFTATADINLVDEKTNSLKQLNIYMDDMFKFAEARKDNSHEKKLDSLLTPPPIDTVKVK